MPASGEDTSSSNMDYHYGSSASCARSKPLSCLPEKEETLVLNDGVSASASFFRSTKNLDEEVVKLRNIYETELEKLRKDVEAGAHERNVIQVQCNNLQAHVWELQNKLSVETESNSKLLDEISSLQRKVGDLDSELQDRDATTEQPQESTEHLRMIVHHLLDQVDQWKHRCEQEQLANQEATERLNQLTKKSQFSEKVHDQQINYYQARLEVASATILKLEAHIQKLHETHASVDEVPADDARAGPQRQAESVKENAKGGTDLPQQKMPFQNGATSENNQSMRADNSLELIEKIKKVTDSLNAKLDELPGDGGESSLQPQIGALKVLLETEKKRLEMLSVGDTTPTLQAEVTKMADTDHNSSAGLSKAAHEKYHLSGIGSSNYKVMADQLTAKSTAQANIALQQPRTSVSTSKAATSFPIGPSYPATDYNYSSGNFYKSGVSDSAYPYEKSPPINTFYIPKELRSEERYTLAGFADFDARLAASGFNTSLAHLPLTGPQYSYKVADEHNQPRTNLSPLQRPLGPIQARSMAPTAQADFGGGENNAGDETKTSEDQWNLAKLKSSEGYNLANETSRSGQVDGPKSPLVNCIDGSSSTFGDLKILEVNEDGKFVRLLNDGPTDFDISGYVIQQTVCDHPVAFFRFPRHTQFPSNSTITVWSATSDPRVHNPPMDFFSKQQKKWKTGSNCTTSLCRANGQMVAWIRAGHRLTVDPFHDDSVSKQDISDDYETASSDGEAGEQEHLTELKVDPNGPRPEPVYLRRAKKQLPTLTASKHPHGHHPSSPVHPLTGQPRPLHFGNDHSTHSHQSRTQTIRPDPASRQPCLSAPVKRNSSKTSRGSYQRTCSATTKENETRTKKCASYNGETCEGPSPFMRPHNRFNRGLDQVCSQHHPDFLPPMPTIFG